jgi:predicted nuclease of predicted toxin-antitoxin system
MIRFIVDAQLPPALARWLVEQGYSTEHVIDFGGDGTTDDEVWAHALQTGAAIISKDEDFPMRAKRSNISPQIVWVRTGNTSRAVLIDWFGKLLPSIIKALDRGERIVEIY